MPVTTTTLKQNGIFKFLFLKIIDILLYHIFQEFVIIDVEQSIMYANHLNIYLQTSETMIHSRSIVITGNCILLAFKYRYLELIMPGMDLFK